MRQKLTILIFAILTLTYSCDRVEDRVKSIVEEQTDKLFPTYDQNTPDTDNNKKRFKEFFGFHPTQDIKDIYCYADEKGIDHDYSFSFHCDTETIRKICEHFNLSNDSIYEADITGLFHDFDWWDTDKIEQLPPYWTTRENQVHHFLWYDTTDTKAYYFEFDL